MSRKNDLAAYLQEFTAEREGLNNGLRASALEPVSGQPGLFTYGLEALYSDELSVYDAPPLQAPEAYLSGLEASPVIGLDTGSELTIKAVQIYLSVSGYKGADGKALAEDGTWGKNTQFALDAWKKANAGKAGVSQIAVDQRKGLVWLPSNIAGDMRAKLSLVPRGQKELARTPVSSKPAQKTDSRNAIPSVQEASAGPGNAFETAQNVRGILRALGVNVANTGLVDTALVQGWRQAADSFGLNNAVSAQEGAAMMAVNATTLSTLRAKSRAPKAAGTKTSKGTTAAATTTNKTSSSAGTVPVQTSEVQRVLRALGWASSVAADGKFGPKTKAAWESSAVSRQLDKTITGASLAPLVNVNSTTLARLQQDASLGASKGSSTSITPVAKTTPVSKPTTQAAPREGLTKVSVGAVQDILIALKVSPGKRDGLWGPNTQKAWITAAQKRKLETTISRAGPTEAWVAPATYAALAAAAKPAAATKPAPAPSPVPAPAPKPVKTTTSAGKKAEEAAPKPGLSKVQVGTLQDLLIRLKANPGKRDGLWGPTTQKGWAAAAKNRSLDSTISRASPTEAWVSPVTLEQLSLAATGKVVKPDEKKPPPSAVDKDLVAVKTDAVGIVLRGFGKQAKTTAELLAAWKAIAVQEKLDERARIEGGALYAVKNTADVLAREASIRISIADLIKASDTNVVVGTLQDAIAFWSNYDATKQRYGAPYKPKSPGNWDADTLMWTLRYLNIEPGVATTVWERALPLLVAKDKKTLKLASKYVTQIGTDAANFKKLGAVIEKKNEVEKKNAAEETQLQKLLDERVKAATVVISIRSLQQALSELNAKIAEGRIKLPSGVPMPPQVDISGVWDAPTRTGMLIAYGEDLLGKLPVGLVDDLFMKLLFKPSGVAGLRGLYGLAAALVGAGATHMRVPPAVAKYIADDAAQWLMRTKTTNEEQPVVFNPSAGGTTQLDPAFITGRAPEPVAPVAPVALPPVEQPSPAGPAPVMSAGGESSSAGGAGGESSSAGGAGGESSSAGGAGGSSAGGESSSAGGESSSAGGAGGSSAGGAGGSSAGGAGGTGGGSTVNITTAAPAQSSMPGGPWMWLAGGALAIGVGLALSNRNGQQMGPQQRTPMRARK